MTFCPHTLLTVLDSGDTSAQLPNKILTHISHFLQSKPDAYRTDQTKRK